MKKLIILMMVIAVATLSTFPVKQGEAYPDAHCGNPVQLSNGQWQKICYGSMGGPVTVYEAPCYYCVYVPVAYYP